MNELAVVRAAVFLCRSLHKHPSRRLIDNLIRTVHGRSIRGTHIDALIAQVVSESENGTVPNTTGPSYASCGTQRDTTGRTRENKNKIIDTVPTLLSVATEREAKAVPAVAKQEPLFAAETAKKEKTKKPRGEPRPGHLILDAVGRLVGPCLVAQTITLWRKCNATVAHDMAAAGITPEMAARDWQRARDAGRTCVTLFALRSWMQMKNVTPFLAVEGPSEDRGPKFREWPASFIDVFHDKITNKWTFSDEWVKAKGLSSNVAWG